ncbi:MAG: FAD binding domain-containing protein [Candidatus Izemoplasmatales bacterium]|jgi:CO/xanthine dehydrogenase FAD-binding subunit|nr:FAD binding domain-containing protein [Candidatus Izemoplasmatales bacterium]
MKINHYLKATTLEEAYATLQSNLQSQIIAGGAWMKLSVKKLDTLISLDDLHLDEIKEVDNHIVIGSMVTLHQMESSALILSVSGGIIKQTIEQIMGIALRNIATIGGSIVSKFGFSDILPVLMLLNPTLVFYKYGEILLNDYLSSSDIKRDILVNIKIPKSSHSCYFKKVKITALDFAILNVAISKQDGKYSIVIGSRPGNAVFATDAMSLLNNSKTVTPELIEEVAVACSNECSFSSNVRATKEYRKHLAYVYTKRGIKEVQNF